MYIIEAGAAKAEFRNQEEIDSVIGRLAESGYRPALRSASYELLRAAGLEPGGIHASAVTHIIARMMEAARFSATQNPLVGDIIFHKSSAIVVQPAGSKIVVLELRRHTDPSVHAEIQGDIAEAARKALDGRRLRGMDFTWESLKLDYLINLDGGRPARNRNFRLAQNRSRVVLTTRPVSMSEEEIEGAQLLVDPEVRLFLQKLVQVGKARSKDAQKDSDQSVVERLTKIGLLKREFLVLCRKDSGTLCTVESREDIAEGFGSRLRCSSCGRNFSDEIIQEVYVPSEMARKLTEGSHWMTIWVTKLLIDSGVDRGSISWGATAGEDEIDLVVDLFGEKVFFELKDREFGLGDAYPFSSRMQRYGADSGFIISTEIVAEEVKNFLKEQRGLTIATLEGKDSIPAGLSDGVGKITKNAALALAGNLFMQADVEIRPILGAWLRR